MTITIYGDFTDAMSRIASIRVDALRGAGVPVEWRAVVQHPTIRVVSEPIGEVRHTEIAEVENTWRTESITGEFLAWRTPTTAPAAHTAVSGFAEAVGAGVGDHVRHLLFSSYWQDNADIGNPDVLRRLLVLPILHGRSEADVLNVYGYAVAISGGPVTSDAWRRIEQWRSDYAGLDHPQLPVCVEDGQLSTGWAALRRLGMLVTELDATFPCGNPYTLPPLPLPAQKRSIAHSARIPVWWNTSPATLHIALN